MSEDRPHMVRSRVGSLVVVVHDAHPPRDAEWEAFLNEFRIVAGKLKAILVYSLGGGPNGPQRSQLTDIFPQLEHVPHAYIVTSSVAVRGIVTAIRWFLPKAHRVKMYAPSDLGRALGDMGLTAEERAEVSRTVKTHLKALGVESTAERAD